MAPPTYPRSQQRREQRYDSARQLDIFSDLNLGPSDEDDDNPEPPQIIHEGISQFAPLLSPDAPSPSKPSDEQPPYNPQPENAFNAIVGSHVRQSDHQTNNVEQTSPQPSSARAKKKKKAKRRPKPQSSVAPVESSLNLSTPKALGKKKNQWADRCMYAELLELNPGLPQVDVEDELPDDLDTGAWVAISGVPVGKRCLAVTYSSSGVAGTGTNLPALPIGDI